MTTHPSSDAQDSQTGVGLSLRWRICIFMGVVLLVSLSVMGYVAFAQSRSLLTEMKLESLALQTSVAVQTIQSKLNDTRQDVLQVPQFPPIPGILRSVDNDGIDPVQQGSTTEIWIERLGVIISAQMRVHPERLYCTFVGEDGVEVMRVERRGGELYVRSDGDIDHSDDTFFQATLTRGAGEIYVSPMQRPAPDRPPVLRAGTPVYDKSGNERGAFVIALNGALVLEEGVQRISDADVDVVDESGQYLYSDTHPGHLFTSHRYEEEMPVRARMLSDPETTTSQALIDGSQRPDGVSLITLYQELDYAEDSAGQRKWAVAPSIIASTALQPVDDLAWKFLWLGGAVVVVAGGATFLASRVLTSALQRLAGTADAIATGDLGVERPRVERMGEVTALANSIDSMTSNLEQSIREAGDREKRARAILDAAFDGMVTIDEQGTIESFNTAAEKLFGYSADEVVGQNVSVLVPSPHREQHDGYLQRYLRTGEARIIGMERELEGIRKDGSKFPIALRISEARTTTGRVFIGTVQDISERKRAEQERVQLFEAIREAVDALATASSEILGTTTQQASTAQQQAASVSETAATVQEITQTAEQSNERTKSVAESARRADEVSQSGLSAVDETNQAMENVREQVESTAENILALAERAQAIGEIISTVNEIADQTNLLALNAAIEASRAGEHGKGFAVVAGEVKALAEQSKKATDQVRQILNEIQQATNTAVISTEQGTKSVTEARRVVKQAEETIRELARTIGDAARSATQVLASSGQQASAMTQISDAMSQIEEAARQSLSSTRQAEQSAQDLNRLGIKLRELLEMRETATAV
ncbi:Sensor protein FixL [Maioricimonas rarisocia]|uniref:Sensor protein FixL n=1 Tax=Maioricimonas rarisocia TaxID=2528026 RepID=A0A517ZAK4_9PLAN|nr:methyl-accepting chemotaxis protein [Maioricimonas rarisocia]QDU39525.1 Sensor protein FixL [Maioricimonas rarisocia]